MIRTECSEALATREQTLFGTEFGEVKLKRALENNGYFGDKQLRGSWLQHSRLDCRLSSVPERTRIKDI